MTEQTDQITEFIERVQFRLPEVQASVDTDGVQLSRSEPGIGFRAPGQGFGQIHTYIASVRDIEADIDQAVRVALAALSPR